MPIDRGPRRGPNYIPSRGPDALVNFEISRDYAPYRDETVLRVTAEVSTGRGRYGDFRDPRDEIDEVVSYLRDQLFQAHGFQRPGGIPDRREDDRRRFAEMASERDFLRSRVRELEDRLAQRVDLAIQPPIQQRIDLRSLFYDEGADLPNPSPKKMLETPVQMPPEPEPPKRKMILE